MDHAIAPTNRKKALEWWRSLDLDTKYAMVHKHHPDRSYSYVFNSDITIERTYQKEMENEGMTDA